MFFSSLYSIQSLCSDARAGDGATMRCIVRRVGKAPDGQSRYLWQVSRQFTSSASSCECLTLTRTAYRSFLYLDFVQEMLSQRICAGGDSVLVPSGFVVLFLVNFVNQLFICPFLVCNFGCLHGRCLACRYSYRELHCSNYVAMTQTMQAMMSYSQSAGSYHSL